MKTWALRGIVFVCSALSTPAANDWRAVPAFVLLMFALEACR
jgi:hypothetical protein